MDNKTLAADYDKYMKSKIATYKFFGILSGALGIVFVLVYFMQWIDSVSCLFTISYSIALLFTINGSYQTLRFAKGWALTSRILATIFYLITLALCAYIVMSYIG